MKLIIKLLGVAWGYVAAGGAVLLLAIVNTVLRIITNTVVGKSE